MRVVVMIAVAVAFILVLATSSPCQRRRLRIHRELENTELGAPHRETLERSAALERAGNGTSGAPVDEQRLERLQQLLLLRQIEEDFERLQNAHNEMMKLAVADHAVDYVRISETAAEIKKRALRLKTNLALPEPGESKKSRTPQNLLEGEQVKASLFVISDLIIGFVTNPLFQHSKLIDAPLSIEASRDLERTIELSDSIRKCAERLRKTSKQSK